MSLFQLPPCNPQVQCGQTKTASLTASYPKVQIGFSFAKAAALVSRPAVLVAALALFCYMALEGSMGSWIRKLMEEFLGRTYDPADASFWAGMVLSLFGVAMAAGRFLSSAVKYLTAIGVRVIAGAAVVSLVSILLMIWTQSAALAIVAIVLMGLAFAAPAQAADPIKIGAVTPLTGTYAGIGQQVRWGLELATQGDYGRGRHPGPPRGAALRGRGSEPRRRHPEGRGPGAGLPGQCEKP